MFGYVRPLRGELKCREFDYFNSVYCGLCHSIGKRYGLPARFILSYDMTFFALVLSALDGGGCQLKKRCIAHPFAKKCVACASDSLDLSADLSVILSYMKLSDSIRDSGPAKSLVYKVIRLLFTPSYRRAYRRRKEFAELTEKLLDELNVLEAEDCPSIDRTADVFASILSNACKEAALDDRTGRILSTMFYHIGRWIYIIDAVADFSEDQTKGEYNPIAKRYQISTGVIDKDIEDELKNTLSHSLATACSAFELLELDQWEGLVANILYLGLSAVTAAVFDGSWERGEDR